MTNEQYARNIQVPTRPIDAVLDTDAFNEIDDQYAIDYLLACREKIRLQAIYAAPFAPYPNREGVSPGVGMEQSYHEILKILDLCNRRADVFRGSCAYLVDEQTPRESEVARDLVERAHRYSPEDPLYVIAIGAITNVASALLIDPSIAENIVIVWLGGNARHMGNGWKEYNMVQDIPAARVVMSSQVPLIQLPCIGTVTHFTVSEGDLEKYFIGKNPVMDYLARNTIDAASQYAAGKPWSRVVWDVTAVGWLMSDVNNAFGYRTVATRLPNANCDYEEAELDKPMTYVFFVNRDQLMYDLVERLSTFSAEENLDETLV